MKKGRILHSTTENTDSPIEETKTKPRESLGHKKKKPIEPFSFDTTLSLEISGKSLLGQISLDDDNYCIKETEQNDKIET